MEQLPHTTIYMVLPFIFHGLNMAHKFTYTPTSYQHLATLANYATLDALAALAALVALATYAAMLWLM